MASRGRRNPIDTLPPEGGVITRVGPGRAQGTVIARVGRRALPAIPANAAGSIGLVEGAAWTEHLRVEVAAAVTRVRARAYAIRVAGSRGMSRRQLELRLARRGVDAAGARAIADELEAAGVLDDRAFADAAARSHLSRRAVGKSVLVAKLRSKGVAGPLATAAADRAIADAGVDPLDAALALARRRAASLGRLEPQAAQRRLYGLLARRGFEPSVCRTVVRTVLRADVDGSADDA